VKPLLDSHVWIWVHAHRERISEDLKMQLETATQVVISTASIWEVAIKQAPGKLAIEGGMEAMRRSVIDMGGEELPISADHALRAAARPLRHRDPFDRMLVAQAEVEGMTLVTADELVRGYGGSVLWAGK